MGLLYEQLASELEQLIRDEVLGYGQRLPSVRQLATEKRLSVSTVLQALRLLEDRGWLEARPQSGFFVRRPLRVAPQRASAIALSDAVTVDVNQRLLGVLASNLRPDVLPFGAALPATDLLPIDAINRLYARVVRHHPHLLCASSHVDIRQERLLRQIVRRSLGWGGPLAQDEILITNSCTEAIALCLKAVTRPGDTVAVESPGYYLMLQQLEELGLKALEIPAHPGSGMSLEALEFATREMQVAACLLVPNASNPLGSIMPDEHKRRLVQLMARRNIPIIEDDIYGDLCFGPQRPWPLKAFDSAGNVMLCSSFSKGITPSLRVGFVAAGRHTSTLARLQTVMSGGVNPVTQMVLAEYLESGAYERHIRGLRRQFETQVNRMHDAVLRYFPHGSEVILPQGGLVLWVELPEAIDTSRIYPQALAQGLSFVPGDLFSARGLYRHCLRLNAGHPWTPQLEEGIRRLAGLLAK